MYQGDYSAQEALQAYKEALSGFVYDDFVEGDEPYILLEDSAVNAETHARYQVLLEKRAQQCGVSIRVVRAIIKEKQAAQNTPGTVRESGSSYFDFSGQPIVLACGKYIQQGDSVCIDDKWGFETVCPHPIIPTKRYINIETGTESLEISFKREGWKSIIVEKGKLANSATIIQLADHGVSVTSETARDMVKYLSYIDDLNREVIPIERMSSHLGWVDGMNFVPYVDGVEYDGQGAFLQMYKTIRERGSYDKWLDAMRGIRAAGCVQARVVMAASFASVLLSKFDALPFFVHLWSPQSGTGKTVTMETAASVWADPQVGAYCRPMKSTNVGLEQLAIFTCNMPLCLDELQTIQGRGGFDDIIYSLCEGSGKTRGARNGGLRHSPSWKNCIITTGEMPIVGGGSKAGAVNRVIEIECKGATIPDAKDVHKIISANYGFAGRRFVEAIGKSGAFEEIEKDQQNIFDMLSEIGTDKQALSASILLAADHAAERIIFQDGVRLTEAEILPYLRTNSEVDSGRRAHEYLLEWVAENKQGFIFDGDLETVKGRGVLGCIDTDAAGNADTVWIIGKSFSQALTDAGFSPDSYLSWAAGQGVIRVDKGQKKINKRIPGSGVVTRCVCLLLNADKETQEKFFTVVHDADLPW
jgi:hypothetical protein